VNQLQREACVPTAVLAAAGSYREGLALAGPDGEFTYGEMDIGSQALASHLAKEGVRHGDLVGLLAPRSARAIVAIMGILRAGGAYVHLDPTLPAERLAFIIEDAGLRAIVADPTSADLVSHPIIDMVEATDGQEIGWEDSQLDPEHLMYVMYTSGSTGEPKGVAVQHTAVANLVQWELQDFGIAADDRASEVSNFTFDASILEIWPYLCAGASVHIAPESVRMFPHALRRWFTEKRITTAWLTSPLAEELLELGLPSDTALRLLVTGGDRLHTRPTSDFPARVVNVYGPTETTVITTAGDVEVRDVGDSLPTIGAPIANVRLYVVDEDGRQVPDGEPGELWIAGPGVSRGYLNRPDLSAERFPTDPFEPGSGRIYRSGDIVRKRPDGRYEFVGRADGQVKLRGLRIEIGEIEARLLERPDVARASVVLIGERDEPELVAYVQPADDSVCERELLNHLARWLPYYMVPERIEQVDALDITANGKIDRRNLIAQEQPR
jgi:amino acid adenylation domain-containing protein